MAMTSEARPAYQELSTREIVIDRSIFYVYLETGISLQSNGFGDRIPKPIHDPNLPAGQARIAIPYDKVFGLIADQGLKLDSQVRTAMEDEKAAKNIVTDCIRSICDGMGTIKDQHIGFHRNGNGY